MSNFKEDHETIEPIYQCRFLTPAQAHEVVNLYHLARTAGKNTRYERMLWASKELSRAHDGVSGTGAYKDLDGLLQ